MTNKLQPIKEVIAEVAGQPRDKQDKSEREKKASAPPPEPPPAKKS